jgi:hypothetical protein
MVPPKSPPNPTLSPPRPRPPTKKKNKEKITITLLTNVEVLTSVERKRMQMRK